MLTTFTTPILTFAKPDVKENTIRIRIKNPGLFQQESFRTITLTSGVKAVVGRRKGQTKTSIQSLIFDKKKYDLSKAKNWVSKHKSQFSQALDLEHKKNSLFTEMTESKKNYVLDRLEEINKILENNETL